TSNPIYMIFYEAFGFFFQTFILVKRKIKKLNLWLNFITFRRIKISLAIIKKYKDYSIYHNLVGLTTLASASLQVIILSINYSASETGLYSLALGMTSLPIQLVSLGTASVIYNQLVAIVSNSPHKLYRNSAKLTIAYMLIGFIPYLIIFLFGKSIFHIVFSSDWIVSGELASLIALPMYLQFCIYPVLSIFMVTDTIKIQFRIDVFFSITTTILLYIFSTYFDLIRTIELHSIALSSYRITMLAYILHVSKKYSQNLKSISAADK
ncbi:MAG: oligosaccharide flippase family protein, partial [Romboutsia sp.]|nr:oligosaccharide flippase family protein [Romboutsia sp.]